RRVRHFPAMAARVPELREEFMHRRVFLSRRSALFDAALAGVAVAALRRSKAPLLAAPPYPQHLAQRARPPRRPAPRAAAAHVAADALSFGALAYSSARNRSLVI